MIDEEQRLWAINRIESLEREIGRLRMYNEKLKRMIQKIANFPHSTNEIGHRFYSYFTVNTLKSEIIALLNEEAKEQKGLK